MYLPVILALRIVRERQELMAVLVVGLCRRAPVRKAGFIGFPGVCSKVTDSVIKKAVAVCAHVCMLKVTENIEC